MSGLTRDDPSHHVQALVQVHADLGGIDDLGWNHRLPTLVPLCHLRNDETVAILTWLTIIKTRSNLWPKLVQRTRLPITKVYEARNGIQLDQDFVFIFNKHIKCHPVVED